MTTVRQLCTGALRLLNVIAQGEAASEDDMAITVSALSGMLDGWSNDRLMIYSINPHVFDLTTSTAAYTLGPAGDWDVTRPMRIENAYVRLHANSPQQLDIKLRELTDEQYGDIAVKNTGSTFPFAFFDNGNYPLRTIYLFPVPSAGNQIVLWLWQPLLDLSNLDAEVTLPPGYERALRFNLAWEVSAEFGKTPSDQVSRTAVISKEELERMNFNPVFLRGDGSNVPRDRARGGASAVITGGFRFGN